MLAMLTFYCLTFNFQTWAQNKAMGKQYPQKHIFTNIEFVHIYVDVGFTSKFYK